MKPHVFAIVVAAQLLSAAFTISAHPGSGIVVDTQGNVYFTYIDHGVGKIDPQGKLTYVGKTHGGHWLCLDADGRFSRTQPTHFQRITPEGVKPALIYADGGSPIAVLSDGNLYYASFNDEMEPGGLQVTRQTPGGEPSIFPADGRKTTEKLGITGLAPGPNGSLYIAQPNAVLQLKMDGTFSTIASSIDLKDCDVDYPDNNPERLLPSLRGIAVDVDGAVFAAGQGCHAVVKISPGGKVETVLKAERPWSPTGVAVHRGEVYILEYTNANGSPNEGWRARVRRLARDGKVTSLFTAPPNQ
jgi:sugar lactone lactonase YvrE